MTTALNMLQKMEWALRYDLPGDHGAHLASVCPSCNGVEPTEALRNWLRNQEVNRPGCSTSRSRYLSPGDLYVNGKPSGIGHSLDCELVQVLTSEPNDLPKIGVRIIEPEEQRHQISDTHQEQHQLPGGNGTSCEFWSFLEYGIPEHRVSKLRERAFSKLNAVDMMALKLT